MKAHWFAAALVVLSCASDRTSADPLSDVGPILVANDWNGMDCDAACVAGHGRQRWLALVPGKDGWSLLPTRLSFDDVDAKGVRSSVAGAEFYLAHPALVAGRAATPDMRFKGNPRSFLDPHAAPLRIVFHGRAYQLAVEGHDVVLRSGDRKSVAGREDADEYEETDLLWAGVLDGDGQLDLILDRRNSKNGRTCLMLSSVNRKPGELVADVGCQFFSG